MVSATANARRPVNYMQRVVDRTYTPAVGRSSNARERLVDAACELMHNRGYPMTDFEHRAADISVDHPTVVQHYRAAQAIALRDERGEADTEELRKGVVHYRALFQELLETSDNVKPIPGHSKHPEVHS